MWNTLSPSLLEGRPNTYTYSKSLGEHVITEEAADLPVAILRPSIIGAAVKDPLPVRRERGGERGHQSILYSTCICTQIKLILLIVVIVSK